MQPIGESGDPGPTAAPEAIRAANRERGPPGPKGFPGQYISHDDE